jgi:hypothetical protein
VPVIYAGAVVQYRWSSVGRSKCLPQDVAFLISADLFGLRPRELVQSVGFSWVGYRSADIRLRLAGYVHCGSARTSPDISYHCLRNPGPAFCAVGNRGGLIRLCSFHEQAVAAFSAGRQLIILPG